MRFFGASQEQLHEWEGRLLAIDARLDRLIDSLETTHDRIKALESAPTADGVVVALAARVDSYASEAAETSRSQHDALDDLDRRIVQLTLATAEGIERVDRAERRVRSTVQRARKELADVGYESAGLEAEATELRLIHGDGSEDEGVRPVPDDLGADGESDEPQPRGIPGHFSQDVLKAMRQRG